MANKKTSIIQMVLCVLLIGFALWIFGTVGDLEDSVQCILDGINALKAVGTNHPGTAAGTTSASAGNAVPDSVMDNVELVVPLIGILCMIPAILIALLSCCIAYNVMKTKVGQGAGCTKCLMCLFVFICWDGFVFYLVVGGVGIMMGGSEGEDAKETLMKPCRDYIGVGATPGTRTLSMELDDAQMALNNATAALAFCTPSLQSAGQCDVTALQSSIDTAQHELDAAREGLNALTKICGCMSDVFDDMAGFTGPGLCCAIVCLILFIMNCCQCCMLCCRKNSKQIVPA